MDTYGRHGWSTYQQNQGYATTTKTTYTYNFGPEDEFSTGRHGETNGFPAGYTGTPYVVVPPYTEPKPSQSWFAGNWLPDFKLPLTWPSLGGRGANTKPQSGGRSSAGPERHRAQYQKPPTYDKGQDYEYEQVRQSHNQSSGDFRSRHDTNGANGHHFGEDSSTRGFVDLQQRSARNEPPVNDSEVLNLKREVKKLQRHMELAEKDYKEKVKSLFAMQMRAEDQEMHASKQENRANGLEKENRSLEKENREYREKLKAKGQEMRELQLKLQHLSAAPAAIEEKYAAEVRKLQHALTFANGQSEDKKQQLTEKVEEQAKRLQELKRQVLAQGLKLQTKDSEAQSLEDELREEREISAALICKLKERSIRIEGLMLTQEIHQQVSAQELKLRNKDSEAQILREWLHAERGKSAKLNEELRQRDIRIAQLDWNLQGCHEKFTTLMNEVTLLRSTDTDDSIEKRPQLSENPRSCSLQQSNLQNHDIMSRPKEVGLGERKVGAPSPGTNRWRGNSGIRKESLPPRWFNPRRARSSGRIHSATL